MPTEIIDLDELVPDDIVFKYRKNEYTIPGDLSTGDTLTLYKLLQRLAETEASGTADELERVVGEAEKGLLPIFQVFQPDMTELPFGATGLGIVLRRILALLGLLQVVEAGAELPVPPVPARPKRAPRRQTQTTTKRGSSSRTKKKAAGGSSKSSS